MIPSARFRIIAATALGSALGIAIWQLWPLRAEVTSQAKSAPKESRAGTSAEGHTLMEREPGKPAEAVAPLPESSGAFNAVMAGLQPKIDAALRAGDYPAAHQVVDEALASAGLQGKEKQRLMVSKLGLLGMKGDHAGMLAWMNEIIAVDPTSPIAQKMAGQRTAIEELAKLSPNDPGFCTTCKGMHGDAEPHLPNP
jgi:hypothetical protein